MSCIWYLKCRCKLNLCHQRSNTSKRNTFSQGGIKYRLLWLIAYDEIPSDCLCPLAGYGTKKEKQERQTQKEELRLVVPLVAIFLAYCSTWIPYLVIDQFLDPDELEYPWAHVVTAHLILLNTVLDPVIYVTFSKTFKDEFLRICCRRNRKVARERITVMSSEAGRPGSSDNIMGVASEAGSSDNRMGVASKTEVKDHTDIWKWTRRRIIFCGGSSKQNQSLA